VVTTDRMKTIYSYGLYYYCKLSSTCSGTCCNGMAHLNVMDGGNSFQIWRAGANIMNKQSKTDYKRWFSSLWVGRGNNLP